MSRVQVVLLDCDGVLLNSVGIKTEAFRTLFSAEPCIDEIVSFHIANGGISRYEKFDHIYRHFLRRPLTAEDRRQLGRRFEDIVEQAVLNCVEIPGARAFLEGCQLAKIVVSGTPQEELRRVLSQRGVDRYLAEIHGSPARKPEIIMDILKRHGWQPDQAVFYGDALTDWEAARETGVKFIGIGRADELADFPEGTIVLPDMTLALQTLMDRF